MNDDRIQEIRERWGNYISFLNERKSAALCNPQHEKTGWYFAICSKSEIDIDYVFTNFDFMEISIKNVQLHPIFQELSDSLQDKALVPRVWNYTPFISYELFVENMDTEFWFLKDFITYYLVAAMKIISGMDIIIPMVSNYSWSCIPAAQDNSIAVIMIEDYPQTKTYDNAAVFTQENLEWVNSNIDMFYHLVQNHIQFQIATEAFVSYNYHANERMCIAALWSGIEALLGIGQELSFRLAAYISAFLEPPGEKRLLMYNKIKKMYAFRSKAVHGSVIKNTQINEHIVETKSLLRQILVGIVENKKMPTADDFDIKLFT